MGRQITYTFHYINRCNMCGSGPEKHKILGKRLNATQGKRPGRKIGITSTIMRCRQCGLIFSNPMPIPENIQDHYGLPAEEYWDKRKMEVDFSLHLPELESIKTCIDFQQGMRSLDIGAGRGNYMKACMVAGFDAYGCEPSEPFYSRLIEHMQIQEDRLQLGKVENIDFPDNFFDYISFVAVLEHLIDPSLVITRCLKWLKPKGIICIEVPSSDWLMCKLFDFYYHMKCLDYTSHLSPMHPPFHLYEFSIKSFQQHALLNGYSIHSYTFFECETFMPKILNRPLKSIMRRNHSGMDLYLWIQKKPMI
jgi:SAM-dependent methyltransferase